MALEGLMPRRSLPRLLAPALCALALALPAGPARAESQAAAAQRKVAALLGREPGLGRWELEGGLGLAMPFEGWLNAGFKLAAGGLYGASAITSELLLQAGGQVAFTYNGFAGGGGSLRTFDFLPGARLRLQLRSGLFAFGDGGLGLAVASDSHSTTRAALLLRLGGGLGLDLDEHLAVVVDPALCFYAKNGSVAQFAVVAGLIVRP
jgi:hypothetical protein